ncbi:MAG: hypothetical protein IT355_02690 [Gemmatimonadaceae bacterium]|nr:hypothetical protein [Gemmatimonadaceae bacterium]
MSSPDSQAATDSGASEAHAGVTHGDAVLCAARRAAHDIASPLGGLRNVVELLRRTGDDPVAREKYLGMLDRAADQIQASTAALARVVAVADEERDAARRTGAG